MRITQSKTELPFPHLIMRYDALPHRQIEALTDQLRAATAREDALIRVRDDLAQRQEMLTQEFEHRLINGLQLIVSLLSLQSRAATTPEAANQLIIASRRGALRPSAACIVGCICSTMKRVWNLNNTSTTFAKISRDCCSRKEPAMPSWLRVQRSRYPPCQPSR